MVRTKASLPPASPPTTRESQYKEAPLFDQQKPSNHLTRDPPIRSTGPNGVARKKIS